METKGVCQSSLGLPALQKLGDIGMGRDGRRYIIKMNQAKMKYWALYKQTKYFIHDNGGVPFLVHFVSPSQVNIHRIDINNNTDDCIHDYDTAFVSTPFMTLEISKRWIGVDPEIKSFLGNTILVKLKHKRNTYIFIGPIIYSFSLLSPRTERIISYQSPVGNSDVPYPYVVTNQHIYFLIEQDVADIQPYQTSQEYMLDPYEYHYTHKHDTQNNDYKFQKLKCQVLAEPIYIVRDN